MLISSLQDQWTIQEGCLKVMYSLKVYISEVSLSSSRIKTNRDERESQSWQCPPRVFPIYGILPPGSQKENIAKLWKNQKITQFPPPTRLRDGGRATNHANHTLLLPPPQVFFSFAASEATFLIDICLFIANLLLCYVFCSESWFNSRIGISLVRELDQYYVKIKICHLLGKKIIFLVRRTLYFWLFTFNSPVLEICSTVQKSTKL